MPSLEKIRQAIGDDRYYEWLQKQMESVELRKKALEQIATYHHVHGAPEKEMSFYKEGINFHYNEIISVFMIVKLIQPAKYSLY